MYAISVYNGAANRRKRKTKMEKKSVNSNDQKEADDGIDVRCLKLHNFMIFDTHKKFEWRQTVDEQSTISNDMHTGSTRHRRTHTTLQIAISCGHAVGRDNRIDLFGVRCVHVANKLEFNRGRGSGPERKKIDLNKSYRCALEFDSFLLAIEIE